MKANIRAPWECIKSSRVRRAVAHLAEMRASHNAMSRTPSPVATAMPTGRGGAAKKLRIKTAATMKLKKPQSTLTIAEDSPTPGRRERRLEFVAANALDEMRYAVGEERAGKEMHEIVIPRHHVLPFVRRSMFEANRNSRVCAVSVVLSPTVSPPPSLLLWRRHADLASSRPKRQVARTDRLIPGPKCISSIVILLLFVLPAASVVDRPCGSAARTSSCSSANGSCSGPSACGFSLPVLRQVTAAAIHIREHF